MEQQALTQRSYDFGKADDFKRATGHNASNFSKMKMSLDGRQNQISSQLNRGGDSSEFNDDMREHTLNASTYVHAKRDEIAESAHQSQGGREFGGGAAFTDGNSYYDQNPSYEVRCDTEMAPTNATGGAEPYLQQDASSLHNRMPHYNTNTPGRDGHAANQFQRLHSTRQDNSSGLPGQPLHP